MSVARPTITERDSPASGGEELQGVILAEVALATGDLALTDALRSAAGKITLDAEAQANSFRGQARRLRADAAAAFASVCESLKHAERDARLAAFTLSEITDEELQLHLKGIAVQEEARVREGLERLERAHARVHAASSEAQELEHEADAVTATALCRPEVAAWHRLIRPFEDRIQRASSGRAVRGILEEATNRGLTEDRLKDAAASRMRELSELSRRTRETVKLWARYASGNGMFPGVTLPATGSLAAVGPGTIFEVSSDGDKVAVHVSRDGFTWARRGAAGPFKARGALVRRIHGRVAAAGTRPG
ncbi:MAG TPA: hypothetical protein VFI11_09640 [Anaerolineales bacterium]|nr:hypothetical protein [Anaerolineales bacterium]